MESPQTSLPIDTFIGLLLVASFTAVAVKWIKMPYAVALVITGLIIGLAKVMPPVVMTPDLVLMIFLPALLFEASWNLDIKALKRDWLSISMLATVGVVVCMVSVAVILHYFGGMTMETAMLFGAMVAATDPVSVVALFRDMGMDKRLTMILEGESLFNDGTAVVLFKIVLAILLSGSHWSLANSIGSFAFVVLGGAAIGIFLGFLASRVTRAFEDHLLEITLTMVTAYGAFLLSDHLKVSPVIAVVAAGIIVGNYGSRTGMSPSTRLAVNSFWEYAAFLVNSLLFLLIGLQVQLPLMAKYSRLIAFGVIAVLVSRLLVVFGLCPFVSSKALPIPTKWRILLAWGGLRGALVMAMALSLPLSFPDRESIINLTFGVVLFTLLVPGLTMEPLVRKLGLIPRAEKFHQYQKWKALLLAYKAELQKLEGMHTGGEISGTIYEQVAKELTEKIDESQNHLQTLALSDSSIDRLNLKQARDKLMEFRKDFLLVQAKQGILNEEDMQTLRADIDSDMDRLENEFKEDCEISETTKSAKTAKSLKKKQQ